jgi:hypothetical protein
MKNRVSAMLDRYRFRVYSGSVNPHTGLKGDDTNAETEHAYFEVATIWIAFEMIAPLFNPTVSPAERILCHFKFAITIVHEFTVSRIPNLPGRCVHLDYTQKGSHIRMCVLTVLACPLRRADDGG